MNLYDCIEPSYVLSLLIVSIMSLHNFDDDVMKIFVFDS